MAQPSYPSKAFASKSCPLCGKPAAESFRPFCSPRCKDVDLNRWLSGVYAVPAAETDDDTGEGKDVLRDRKSD
jgi:uncharacterized protein